MRTELVFGIGEGRTSIGAIFLDSLRSETNQLDSDVTSHPVEDGIDVTDHIAQRAEEVTIVGLVSGAQIHLYQGGRTRLILVKEALREIHEQRVPVTVTTGVDKYEDFAVKSIKIKREAPTDWLEVTATLVKIIKADVEKVDIPPQKVQNKVKYVCKVVTDGDETTVSDEPLEEPVRRTIIRKASDNMNYTDPNETYTSVENAASEYTDRLVEKKKRERRPGSGGGGGW